MQANVAGFVEAGSEEERQRIAEESVDAVYDLARMNRRRGLGE
jgi:hypothetical protein